MKLRSYAVCLLALLAACGTEKSQATAADETAANGANGSSALPATTSSLALGASKMAQQTTASSQSQADQSETATSGSDDQSGTSKLVQKREQRGQLGIHPTSGIDFNDLISGHLSGDFDVALDFNAWLGPDLGSANGNVTVSVHRGGDDGDDITLTGSIEQAYDDSRHIHQSTEPNITVTKKGSRGMGKVVRQIRGTLRRMLQSTGDPNTDFDFLINHQSTVVTDLYASSTLTSRTVSGTATVTDANNAVTAVITFNDVVRPAPSVCLCPTQGSITVAYTAAGVTQTITHAFNGTCGQVVVTEPWSTAAVANGSAQAMAALSGSSSGVSGTASSSTASAGTASSSTTAGSAVHTSLSTWDLCTPGNI